VRVKDIDILEISDVKLFGSWIYPQKQFEYQTVALLTLYLRICHMFHLFQNINKLYFAQLLNFLFFYFSGVFRGCVEQNLLMFHEVHDSKSYAIGSKS
jgi:hypothetical protein